MKLLRYGHLMDPASGLDDERDLVIDDQGRIAEIAPVGSLFYEDMDFDEIIDLEGKLVAPGFVDVHVHFRDPGLTYKEDIVTGAAAAAAGGYTTVICMANTSPSVDSVAVLEELIEREEKLPIHVLQTANVTKGMRGQELVDFAALYGAGAVGFTDDGIPIADEKLLREALIQAKMFDVPISLHEENPALIGSQGVNAGPVARELGLEGASDEAEYVLVARDVMLNRKVGAKLDIQHISSKVTVDILRQAKREGICVYGEVTPQHLAATEELVRDKGALARVNPPLRTEEDRRGLIEGLRDGTIDMIATDHAPHAREEKERPIAQAPSGMIGLETAFALVNTYAVREGGVPLMTVLRALTVNPARLYGLEAGQIAVGKPADLVVLDPDETWEITDNFRSKARNSPFIGWKVTGRVKMTICGGELVG